MIEKISAEKIEENFKKFSTLCNVLGEERSKNVSKLIEYFGERLALCPASSKVEFHACYPGGLIEHSLCVLSNAYKLSKIYLEFDKESIKKDSIILCSLMHDIGKVGDLKNDYYIVNDSQWHVEKGLYYKINSAFLQYMTVEDRSLYLLQHFDIKLSLNEWLAIRLPTISENDETKSYKMKENGLGLLLNQAIRISIFQEKNYLSDAINSIKI